MCAVVEQETVTTRVSGDSERHRGKKRGGQSLPSNLALQNCDADGIRVGGVRLCAQLGVIGPIGDGDEQIPKDAQHADRPATHRRRSARNACGSAHIGECARKSPNDPKLSHGPRWRGPCMAGGEGGGQEAGAVTARPVGCSAWLGVGDCCRSVCGIKRKAH